MKLREGTLLKRGDYKIEKVLGQGGFGITYLAEQTGLGRKVALKEFFMQEHCNRDADGTHVSVGSVGSKKLVERFRQKFLKEARLIASFDNSNIIKIHDVFEENGTAYYVMEYLEGKSLKATVEESGALTEAAAVKYIREVADALREIHSHNLLHLDIKPANIMLSRKGQAVLIDFGISKHYDEGGAQTSSALIGTSEGYAPLEQYEAGALDNFTPATDIYALGATLFFLLTGIRPPKASEVMNDGLPVLPQEISPAVRNAVETAMQPRRKDRPQDIGAFLSLLHEEDNTATIVAEVIEENDIIVPIVAEEHPAHPVPTIDTIKVKEEKVESGTEKNKANGKETTPPPASKEAQSLEKQGESKGKGKWLFLLILLLAVMAGAAWYVTNGIGGDKNKGSNTNSNNPSQKVATPVVGGEQTPLTDSIKASSAIVEEVANIITDTIKEDAPVVQTCNLIIKTTPSGATIKIDGEKVGTTPLAAYKVEQGKHTINIAKEGYKEYEETFDLNIATKNLGTIKLEKLTTNLVIKTTPSGATIKIDGKKVGTTPLTHKIEQGKYTINITKDGYEPKTVVKELKSDVELSYELQPKPKKVASPAAPTRGVINGHEYVDLGLPSGLKWATCNVGASSPEYPGDHYAWGETTTKLDYNKDNYKYCDGSSFVYIGKDISGTKYDVARKRWGGSWRLPTNEDFQELIDNCNWEWTTQNRAKGYKVTSKKNGNSIFLPAAGCRDNAEHYSSNSNGLYWSATSRYSNNAYDLCFDSDSYSTNLGRLYYGLSVRPVSE